MKATDHILEGNLNRYARREADAAEILRIQTHLSACEVCRQKLAVVSGSEKSFAAVRENFAFDESADEPEHLTYEHLEFFLDHKLDDVTQEIVESHLAFCGECERDLQDLIRYREIAQAAPAIVNETIVEPSKVSFWQKIFAFDSIGSFAPVAAVLLIAIFVGAWFLLRGNRTEEIAQGNANQNIPLSNLSVINSSPAANVSPETEPQISPSPAENVPPAETLYALNDGQLKVDEKGNLKGAENLSPSMQNLLKQSLQTGKVSIANNSLGGGGGVLMGEGNAENGVPFALSNPIGKVILENQPILKWKPLKDAQSYSVAIVDEKFRVVAESGKLTVTSWKPSKPLPRGTNYSWQVTATKADGSESVSPSSPAPQARFRVVEQTLSDDINRLKNSAAPSHLALGVLYAKAGLRQEARAEFEKLVKENPNSPLARKLLQSVR